MRIATKRRSAFFLCSPGSFDPWEEAASLAQLPRASATKRLVSLISATPGGRSARQDAGTLSDRLIALLPRPAAFIAPRQELGAPRFVIWAILIAFLLAIQLVMISRVQTTHVDTGPAPIPSTALP